MVDIDIDIEPKFGVKLMNLKRSRSLNDLMSTTKQSISKNVRRTPDASQNDINDLESILDDFAGVFLSLTDEVDKAGIFRREKQNGYFSLVRNFAAYSASKSVLNKLNNEGVQKIKVYDVNNFSNGITQKDLLEKSDTSVLYPILENLQKIGPANNCSGFRYKFYKVFEDIRLMSKTILCTNANPETLKELENVNIYKKGLNFSEIKLLKKEFEKNGKEKSSQHDMENLPGMLKAYEPRKKARLDSVIGNHDAIEKLRSAFIKVGKYDQKTKSNPFNKNGSSFKSSIILHGPPGTGKNTTIDAILNYYTPIFHQFGVEYEICDLAAETKSMYKDRSALIFEKYLALQEENNKIYINVVDEVDGVLGIDERGEMSDSGRKILREIKKTIDYSERGNRIFIWMTNYPEYLEAAFKNKSIMVELEGPTSNSDFTKSFKHELGMYSKYLSEKEFNDLGANAYDIKIKLDQMNNPVPFTFRDVEAICQPYISGNDKLTIANESAIFKTSSDKFPSVVEMLVQKPTYNVIMNDMVLYAKERMKGAEGKTARYNKR